jgi:hypothetical protein
MEKRNKIFSLGKKILVETGLVAFLLSNGCIPIKNVSNSYIERTSNLSKILDSEGKTITSYDKKSHNLDDKIPVREGFPPGGVGYIDWEFKKDFERLDVDLSMKNFDTSKDFYLQLYQSKIGNDRFYFGIQNRTKHNDQMLIFSRKFNDIIIAAKLGIDKYFSVMDDSEKIKAYGDFFKRNPSKKKEYRKLAESYARCNSEGGFIQSATYEGSFVGIRLPNFNLRNDNYRCSIIKDGDDSNGTWYRYVVTNKSTDEQIWVGSLKFDKGSKINKQGSTWTELFGEPWPVQTYKHLPNWDTIVSVQGDGKFPKTAMSSYTDQNWGDHIPMQDVSCVSKKTVRMQLGPDVVRKNKAGRLF